MANNDDDSDAFRKAMHDIKPLRHDKVDHNISKPAPIARFTLRDQQAVLAESLASPEIWVESGNEVQFSRAGLSPKVLKKLKRGSYTVQEEMDLHGLNAADAKQAVTAFLREAKYYRWSCIRIIHGKGNRSYQGIPVLRPKVVRWLRQNELVVAFCTATANDGGTGALYVLLDV